MSIYRLIDVRLISNKTYLVEAWRPFQYKDAVFVDMKTSIVKIRRSHDRPNFILEILKRGPVC